MNTWKAFAAVLALGFAFMLTVACKKEGPAEKAGKKIDAAVEKAGKKVEETGEAIKKTAEEAQKEYQKATQPSENKTSG